MQVTELDLRGLKLLTPQCFKDSRGHFFETYRYSRYEKLGIDTHFVQDNHSLSSYKTIRGMHFQSFPGQDKLISVLKGEIFDCVVDMRPSSPTFKQWQGVYLNDQNHQQLYIPIGFAHGFCVLSSEAYVIYKVSSDYNPETEMGFRYDDPEIAINWPFDNPVISPRDAKCPSFDECMKSLKAGSI